MLLAPIFIMAVVVALLETICSSAFLFTGEPLKMKLSKAESVQWL